MILIVIHYTSMRGLSSSEIRRAVGGVDVSVGALGYTNPGFALVPAAKEGQGRELPDLRSGDSQMPMMSTYECESTTQTRHRILRRSSEDVRF